MALFRSRRTVVVLLCCVLILGGVAWGLAAYNTPSPQASSSAISADDGLPTATPRPPSTLQKILDAVTAGRLNKSTSWLYRVYGALDPRQLPAELKGVDLSGTLSKAAQAGAQARTALWADVSQARGALAAASRHWSEIPDALKARFLPFRQRPTNPESFWYTQVFSQASSVRGPGLAAPAAATSFAYVDAAHTPVRVWYVQDRAGTAKALATRLANEIDSSGMWDKEKAVMLGHTPCSDADLSDNGGNGRFDLYVIPPGRDIRRSDGDGNRAGLPKDSGDYTTEGLTVPEDSSDACPSTDFILLNDNQDWDELRSTTAHELFHAFQDSFQQSETDADWWAEATATWAEDYIYPTLDQEQQQLEAGGWARNTDPLGPLDLFQDDGLAQYGAYIWPFYLTHRPGGDPTLIGKFYQAAEQQTPLEVMHALPDWPARFKEFALWDWNGAPVDLYRDHGAHIAPLAQTPQKLGDNGTLSLATSSDKARVNLQETSIAYYEVAKIDDGQNNADVVHQLRFDLHGVTGQAGAGVQAILTIGSGANAQRTVEDWSSLDTKTFCRDRAGEQVSKVVLVVTNSNIDSRQRVRGQIRVDAIADACR
jgi:hypothetical protein